jgi:hypothetical protein
VDFGVASIVVASITAIGGILVAIIQRLRKENKQDHYTVRDILKDMREDIQNVDSKLDGHIEWHMDNLNKK